MSGAKHVITDTRELTVLHVCAPAGANKLNSLNLTPTKKQSLLHSIAEEVRTQTEERFELQKSPDGAKWQNISERTRAYYIRHRRADAKRGLMKGSLLNRTRQLRDSLTTKVDGSQALVGATKVYAAVHQFGYKKIPARPYLGINTENENDIKVLIQNFFEKNKATT